MASLRHYLDLTKDFTEGPLFRGESSGSPLSADLLRVKVLYFVNRADPNGNFEVHQLRKVAASLNLVEYLYLEDLKQIYGLEIVPSVL